jgi:hypothetical protein
MDSPAIEIEPEMPAWTTVEGHMVLKFFPSDPAMRDKTTGTWSDVGTWYYSLDITFSAGLCRGRISETRAGGMYLWDIQKRSTSRGQCPALQSHLRD